MKNRRMVQYAVACLKAFDTCAARALSPRDISQSNGVPLPECIRILQKLSDAGIVQFEASGKVTLKRSLEDLTTVDVLEALWAAPPPQAIQMLVGGSHGMRLRKTFDWLGQLQARGCEVNG